MILLKLGVGEVQNKERSILENKENINFNNCEIFIYPVLNSDSGVYLNLLTDAFETVQVCVTKTATGFTMFIFFSLIVYLHLARSFKFLYLEFRV